MDGEGAADGGAALCGRQRRRQITYLCLDDAKPG